MTKNMQNAPEIIAASAFPESARARFNSINGTHPRPQGLRAGLLLALAFTASLVLVPLASFAQGISDIGAVVPNTTLGFSPVAGSSEPRIQWINGEYQESHTDLSVKVLGGSVDIARSWSQGRWWLNPAWAPLNFELDPLGKDAKIIERAGVIYERSGQSDLYIAKSKGSASVYIKALQSAAGQVQGWQWYDRLGNTIDYDREGRIQSYANASGVRVSFAYDSASSARILDHHGATIYTVTMAGGLITKIEDLTGRSVSYQWTGQRLTQVTDVLGAAWKYEYDGNGQITRRTDPLGAQTTAHYSQSIKAPEPLLSLGKAGTVIDPSGASGTTQKLANIWGGGRVGRFDSKGCTTSAATQYLREQRVFQVTHIDCRGNTTVTVSDLQGNELNKTFNGQRTASTQWDGAYVQKSTDARGHTTTTSYDTNYQPLQITYPDGSVEKNTYEPIYGHKTSHTNQLGVITTWAYDSKGRVVESVQAKGQPEQRTTRYQYDQWGQLTSTTRGAGDGKQADAITQTYTYDSAGNVTSTTDGQGNTTATSYDRRGAPTSRTDALNRTTTFSIDAAGRLTQSTDPLGHSTQLRYDARGRRTHTISPTGKTQVTRYDSEGRAIETLAPGQSEGAGTRIEYDTAGQPIKTTSPSGLVMQTSYDTQGRISKTTDPAGNVTSYEYGQDGTTQAGLLVATQYPTYKETYQYDSQSRQTTVTQHLENGQTRTQSQTYDALGQRVASTDPAGNTTQYRYDALGRQIETIDSLNQSTKQSWDAQDQLIAVTDANGNTHRFDYDKAGRLIKEARPLGGAIEYSYDAAGQLTQRKDAGTNTRTYSYDPAGRMTLEEHRLQGSTLDQRISRRYDNDGQLASYEQQDGTGKLISSASYTKDLQGRTTQSAITYGKVTGSGTIAFTLGQGFNADGQLASHTYPDGSQQSYAYDKGRLSQVTLPNQSQISYGNYQWNAPGQITTPGATKTLAYDALQRHTRIEVKNNNNNASQLLALKTYQYDLAGNITQIDSDLGTTQYGYDKLSRLTQATPDNNLKSLGLPQEQYGYDPVGNRTSSGHQPGAWSYNADNQLTRYPRTTPFSGAAPADTSVSFTAQGHTAQEKSGAWQRDYRYNAAERLIETSQNGQTTSYRYDPFGRRISKTAGSGAASTTTYFLYSDTGLLAEATAKETSPKPTASTPRRRSKVCGAPTRSGRPTSQATA
jgi:YD repeat-containing protein